MKNTGTILMCFLLPLSLSSQQTTLHGVVALFNSKFETGFRKYVANAQVEEDFGKSHASTTRSDGAFDLLLIGKKEGIRIIYSVKKRGLEVVNTDALEAVAGQTDTQRVFMAPEGKIAENKLRYYKINREASEKALTARLNHLQQEIDAAAGNQGLVLQLQAEYGNLKLQYDKIDESARELAERYARTNLDDVSADYQRAFSCFERGQLDSALLILKAADLESTANTIVEEQNRNKVLSDEYAQRNSAKNKRKQETNEALKFKAALHYTQFEFDKVSQAYDLLLKLDSLNIENLLIYAKFLTMQNQIEKAIYYNEKALRLNCSTADSADILNILGLLYRDKNEYGDAETAFLKSIDLKKSLTARAPEDYSGDIALTKINLGTLYLQQNNYSIAETEILPAVKTLKDLTNKKPGEYEDLYASSLANLSIFYEKTGKHTNSIRFLNESLSIHQKQDFTLTSTRGHIGNDLVQLGAIYRSINKYSESEAVYLKALDLLENLDSLNPEAYRPKLGILLHNLGNLYSQMNNFQKSTYFYKRSISIHEGLFAVQPFVYKPLVASNYSNLGALYHDYKFYNEAKYCYDKSIEIREELVKQNPRVFEPDLAETLGNLGTLYIDLNNFQVAQQFILKSIGIFEKLSKDSFNVYRVKIAEGKINLGTCYYSRGDMKNARRIWEEALDSILFFSKKPEDTIYLPKIAEIYNNLGAYYVRVGNYSQANQYMIKSAEIYKNISANQYQAYGPQLARAKFNLANTYTTIDSLNIADRLWSEALQTYEMLASYNPQRYNIEVCKTLQCMSIYALKRISAGDNDKKWKEKGAGWLKKSLEVIQEYPDDFPEKQKAKILWKGITVMYLQLEK